MEVKNPYLSHGMPQVHPIGEKDKNYVPVTFGSLITSSPKTESPSVGLPMSGLINETPVANQTYINTNFNNLISQDYVKVDRKFGVSLIPDGTERTMLPKPTTVGESLHINKSNQAPQPSGRKVNNWFSRLLDQRGQDYISSGKLTIDEVSKNAERILDDMIAGKIDYDFYGQYIIASVIIETLVNYCSNKLAINRAIQFTLGYTYNDYVNRMNIQDPERFNTIMAIDDSLFHNITQSIAIVNQDIAIYTILYNKLSYVNATKNASSLFSLTNDLNNYRKQIKKRY